MILLKRIENNMNKLNLKSNNDMWIKQPYATTINIEQPKKFVFCFEDGSKAVYDNFKDLQDFLEKIQKQHKLELENKKLKIEYEELTNKMKILNDNFRSAMNLVETYRKLTKCMVDTFPSEEVRNKLREILYMYIG